MKEEREGERAVIAFFFLTLALACLETIAPAQGGSPD